MKQKLRYITREFFKGLLEGESFSKPNNCLLACQLICPYLGFLGWDAEIVEGEVIQGKKKVRHFWIKIREFIIDPTAHQFKTPTGRKRADIFVGKKPKWYLEL